MRAVTITGDEAGQRLDKFLRRFFPGAASGFLYRMLRKKNIVLNSAKANGREILAAGDELTFWFSEETYAKLTTASPDGSRSAQGLDPAWILYEDRDILLLNKPAGLLSQRARPEDVSLVELIRGYLLSGGQMTDEDFRRYAPGVLNRLDRNTSGLVLAAKTFACARALSELLAGHRAEKYYLALVEGRFEGEERQRAFLHKDEAKNRSSVSTKEADGSRPIEMLVRTVADGGKGYSLLQIQLITGRSHQIRAHLSALGCPIAGDGKYGNGRQQSFPRQMLHAWKLCFPPDSALPGGIANRGFIAPLPADMRTALTETGIQTGEWEAQ